MSLTAEQLDAAFDLDRSVRNVDQVFIALAGADSGEVNRDE